MASSMMSRSHIPVEIITDILSCLPVKPLVRFLYVSKQWYAVITSSHPHPQGRQPPSAYPLFFR